jgi:hypothetical protein
MIYSTKKEKKRNTFFSKGSFVIILIAILILVGYYFINAKEENPTETIEEITVVDEVLLRNLETNYPPSPKEVIRYYCEISQLFYEEISE